MSLQVDDLTKVASDVDVLYMTRIQKERFTDMEQYKEVSRSCMSHLPHLIQRVLSFSGLHLAHRSVHAASKVSVRPNGMSQGSCNPKL
jgi:aspartate carbamoyltransferase catalytic subunit